jgi:hypothetical protein
MADAEVLFGFGDKDGEAAAPLSLGLLALVLVASLLCVVGLLIDRERATCGLPTGAASIVAPLSAPKAD